MHKTVLVPVLYGEGETQILVVNDITLPEPALKIWDVKLTVQKLEAHVCKEKVIIQGVLHKQIVFVNKKTNLLQHHPADVPFSGFIEIPCAEPGMELTFLKVEIKENCGGEKLISCQASESKQNEHGSHGHFCPQPDEIQCVHEKHIIDICVAVTRTEKVCINEQCPPPKCPPPNCEKGDKYHDTHAPNPLQTGCSEWYPRGSRTQT